MRSCISMLQHAGNGLMLMHGSPGLPASCA